MRKLSDYGEGMSRCYICNRCKKIVREDMTTTILSRPSPSQDTADIEWMCKECLIGHPDFKG